MGVGLAVTQIRGTTSSIGPLSRVAIDWEFQTVALQSPKGPSKSLFCETTKPVQLSQEIQPNFDPCYARPSNEHSFERRPKFVTWPHGRCFEVIDLGGAHNALHVFFTLALTSLGECLNCVGLMSKHFSKRMVNCFDSLSGLIVCNSFWLIFNWLHMFLFLLFRL